MKKISCNLVGLISILICCTMNTFSQSLKDLPNSKRDSILLDVGKKAILEFGDERYYTEHVRVNITRQIVPQGDHKGRALYTLTYEYDPTKYTLEWHCLAKVNIWEDTGKLENILFGSGSCLSKDDIDNYREKRKAKVPYPKIPFEFFPKK